jgi:NADPH:quinone reductase-like Zn-dependent oxidoreductase
MADNGKIKLVVSNILSLRDVIMAHQLIEGKHTRGKIVLRVI